VIASPVYSAQWEIYNEETLREYKTALAQVVNYWDFSCTSVSYDSRYFYDATHFRNAVGTMVLAEIFGNDDVYRPENFGTYVTAENCEAFLDDLFSAPPTAEDASYTKDVPILMYHHFADEVTADTYISPAVFDAQMKTLSEAGYTAVTFQEMIDYVYHGGSLPEKPVCITIDDGYYSNYEIAWPILEKYGMKATVFAIGVSVGHMEYYKDTLYPITPHFGYEEAREMLQSGVIDLQSHSYDMHQWADFEENELVRSSMLPFDGESESEYASALQADMELYDALRRQALGEGFCALAYPGGRYNNLVEVLVHEAGIPVTVSTRTDSRNVLVRGLPQSLYALCRMNVTDQTTGEELLAYLGSTSS
ncbi:MAG: polysaccharide deacetylase family protein, partial [Faecousia sp.]